jgi:hypothetical protein
VHLVEISVMEQRYQAVMPSSKTAGRSTRSPIGSACRVRACTSGSPATTPVDGQPRRRLPSTAELCPDLLGARGDDPLPGRSRIHRCLKRHNLIELRRRKKRRDEFRRLRMGPSRTVPLSLRKLLQRRGIPFTSYGRPFPIRGRDGVEGLILDVDIPGSGEPFEFRDPDALDRLAALISFQNP